MGRSGNSSGAKWSVKNLAPLSLTLEADHPISAMSRTPILALFVLGDLDSARG